jgi:hypothetical protein
MTKEFENIMDFVTWVYTLGESRKEIEEVEKILQKLIDSEEFDEDAFYAKSIFKSFHKLQFIKTNMSP